MPGTEAEQRSQQASRTRGAGIGVAVATLCVGAALAVGLGLGGVWMARTGIFAAALAGLGALVVLVGRLSASETARLEAERGRGRAEQGWRQAERQRQETEVDAAERIRTMERRHHDESMDIIARFSHRVRELGAEIVALQAEVGRLSSDLEARDRLVGSLRGTQQVLLDNAVDYRARIARLEQQIAVREAELQGLVGAEPMADVVTLPVRRQLLPVPGEQRPGDTGPDASGYDDTAHDDTEHVVWDEAVGH